MQKPENVTNYALWQILRLLLEKLVLHFKLFNTKFHKMRDNPGPNSFQNLKEYTEFELFEIFLGLKIGFILSWAVPAEWDTYENFDLRSANQKPWRKITIACKIETTANERKNVYYQLYLAARKELTGQLLFVTFGLLRVILIFTLHIAVSEKRICVGRSGDRINIVNSNCPCFKRKDGPNGESSL